MVDLIRSTIGMVDLAFWDDFFKQNRSWDDFGTIISGSQGTHQNSIGSRMPVLAIFLLFGIILKSFWRKIIQQSLNLMFFPNSDFQKRKKKTLPGCLQTVVRSGDAPKPPFPIKTNKKSKKSGNQPQINHRNYPLFLSLLMASSPEDLGFIDSYWQAFA